MGWTIHEPFVPLSKYFKHLVIDDFLASEVRAELLDYALARPDRFEPTTVYNKQGAAVVEKSYRKSWLCMDGIGPFRPVFEHAVEARLPQFFEELGTSSFQVEHLELELVAHRDGSFFRAHIDTATQAARDRSKSDRAISCVYYFHSTPKVFSGGELAILPLGAGEPRLVEPRDNRLVAFASFVPHEVRAITCVPDAFPNARFAVNCWLHRRSDASA